MALRWGWNFYLQHLHNGVSILSMASFKFLSWELWMEKRYACSPVYSRLVFPISINSLEPLDRSVLQVFTNTQSFVSGQHCSCMLSQHTDYPGNQGQSHKTRWLGKWPGDYTKSSSFLFLPFFSPCLWWLISLQTQYPMDAI